MRFVLDTSVLVSYLFWLESPLRPIIDEIFHQGEVLRSAETFSELSEVVMRRKFDPYLPMPRRELFLAAYYDNSTHVLITRRIDACRDPKDNKFLELAACGRADFILTGDADLLVLDPFQGVRIISPASISLPTEEQ